MTGASGETGEVDVVDANWVPAPQGGDGSFAFLLVTRDGARHVVEDVTPAAATAVVSILATEAPLMWDPGN